MRGPAYYPGQKFAKSEPHVMDCLKRIRHGDILDCGVQSVDCGLGEKNSGMPDHESRVTHHDSWSSIKWTASGPVRLDVTAIKLKPYAHTPEISGKWGQGILNFM